jgi:hypothetical protein
MKHGSEAAEFIFDLVELKRALPALLSSNAREASPGWIVLKRSLILFACPLL